MAIAPPFVFTPLIEPASSVSQTPPPAPFNPVIAYLLGQCCNLTYVQFDAGLGWTPDFSSLTLNGYTITASNPQLLTLYEAIEPGPTTGDVGDYVQLPAGFIVQLKLVPTGGQPQTILVVALRGTRTWEEWFTDVDGLPTPFAVQGTIDGLGSVHAGFFGLYTIGENGLVATNPLAPGQRAKGSIAYQIAEYFGALGNNLPVYLTGHSLGGALASLCALDIAYYFRSSFAQICMYSLASPRVAASLSPVPTLDNLDGFLSQYQNYVPNSYQIVHAADLVPIVPPAATALGPLTLTFAQVTDPWQVDGTGATATATVSNGAVTAVSVNNTNSKGYSATSFAPIVQFSGGGGSGAAAVASVDIWGNVSVNVTRGGSGYTSAPAVQIAGSGALPQNVINFCAQSGDIGTNHSCAYTYVPYLQKLADGF